MEGAAGGSFKVRAAANYGHTTFEDGAVVGIRVPEDAFFSRFQNCW